jgi:hypothetical protein
VGKGRERDQAPAQARARAAGSDKKAGQRGIGGLAPPLRALGSCTPSVHAVSPRASPLFYPCPYSPPSARTQHTSPREMMGKRQRQRGIWGTCTTLEGSGVLHPQRARGIAACLAALLPMSRRFPLSARRDLDPSTRTLAPPLTYSADTMTSDPHGPRPVAPAARTVARTVVPTSCFAWSRVLDCASALYARRRPRRLTPISSRES